MALQGQAQGQVAEALSRARDRLLDITARNQLINFRPTKRTSIRIVDEVPSQVWRLLVAEERALSFLAQEEHPLFQRQPDTGEPAEGGESPQADGADEAESDQQFELPDMATALEGEDQAPGRYTDRFLQTAITTRNLQTNLLRTYAEAQSVLEEKGVNVLFLAFGLLHWRRSDQPERDLQAPLVLVPVELARTSAGNRFNLRVSGEDPVLNPCLAAMLTRDFRVAMPDAPEDWASLDLQRLLGELGNKVASLPNWRVEPAMWLGLFTFSKYLMYVDLDSTRWPADHPLGEIPLVRVMCGDQDALGHEQGAFPDPEQLDDLLQPADVYSVLDADSSQMGAILAAKSGRSIVIIGPPGTGKSQTITNVIAECLSAGKTVLFVSEKMAALEVVKRRLDQVGLGDFCLELHSTKASRKAVVQELARVLESGRKQAPADEGKPEKFVRLRERLNGYVRALHTPLAPSGVTPYHAMGRVAELSEAKDVVCRVPELLEWNAERLDEQQRKIDRLARQMEQVWPVRDNPWRGARLTRITSQVQQDVADSLAPLPEALQAMKVSAGNLAARLDVPEPETFGQMLDVQKEGVLIATCASVPFPLVADERWDAVSPEVRSLLGNLKAVEEQRPWVDEHYDAELAGRVDWRATLLRWQASQQNILWFLWPPYLRDRKQIRLCRKSGYRPDASQVPADLQRLVDYQQALSAVESQQKTGEKFFGPLWRGAATKYEDAVRVGNSLLAVRKRLRSGRLSDSVVAALKRGELSEVRQDLERMRECRQRWDAAWQRLVSALELDDQVAFDGGLAATPIAAMAERIGRMGRRVEDLHHWGRYQDAVQSCRNDGLAEFVDKAEQAGLEPAEYPDAANKLFHRLLAERATAEREEVGQFSGPDHEADRQSFCQLDCDLVEHNSYRLYAHLSHQRPATGGSATSSAADSSQLGILQGEIARKRGGRSIRRLMRDACDVVQKLKPCFMMSPLSVAQFLEPGGMAFDLAVFDEASQVQPEDALGAIARGRQLVLVGDPKQLPPTSFFTGIADAEETQESDGAAGLADMESILDRGWMVLPRTPLRWHYRSRHESLISFSNREFYEGELVVFPSCHHSDGQLGVVVEYHPDDWYDRSRSGTNRAQAARIAESVLEHARRTPDESLGVGAFSQRQQQAILDEVERLRRLNPDAEGFFGRDRAEPFFVKNLETIQGDERDVILLSVGYGKTQPGDRLHMNFGPLNQDGGWRRLNVLITRARRRCVIFTSIRPEDFDLSATQARGVHALHDYLHYAFTGEMPATTGPQGGFESDFERAVCAALRQEGLEVQTQVGCAGYAIDLAVVDPREPGRYILGIECDGATYHRSATARDRDRLREQVLVGLGWRIHRVWSTDWFRTPQRELQRLLQAVDEAAGWDGEAPEAAAGPDHVVRDPAEELPRADSPQEESVFVPYAVCELGTSGPSDAFYRSAVKLQRDVEKVVQIEGPIHEDELARRVARAWGINRTGSEVKKAIHRAVAAATKEGTVEARGDFLWPKGVETPPVRKRGRRDVRNVKHICLEELCRAAYLIAKLQFGISRADLIVQVARVFGFNSTGGKISAAVSEAIDKEMQAGHIIDESGSLKAVDKE